MGRWREKDEEEEEKWMDAGGDDPEGQRQWPSLLQQDELTIGFPSSLSLSLNLPALCSLSLCISLAPNECPRRRRRSQDGVKVSPAPLRPDL